MKITLSDAAAVEMGYSFRSRVQPSRQGNVAIIQMRDLREDTSVDTTGLARIPMGRVRERQRVQPGDLVFRSRGNHTTAAIVDELPPPETAEAVIVAAPLLRIRVTCRETLLPEYLCWYIEQRAAQNYLARRAHGSTGLLMIDRRTLETLPVTVPAWERQKRIVQIARLHRREQYLQSALAGKRAQYITQKLTEYAQEEIAS